MHSYENTNIADLVVLRYWETWYQKVCSDLAGGGTSQEASSWWFTPDIHPGKARPDPTNGGCWRFLKPRHETRMKQVNFGPGADGGLVTWVFVELVLVGGETGWLLTGPTLVD